MGQPFSFKCPEQATQISAKSAATCGICEKTAPQPLDASAATATLPSPLTRTTRK
jgi:hypothetical protein